MQSENEGPTGTTWTLLPFDRRWLARHEAVSDDRREMLAEMRTHIERNGTVPGLRFVTRARTKYGRPAPYAQYVVLSGRELIGAIVANQTQTREKGADDVVARV